MRRQRIRSSAADKAQPMRPFQLQARRGVVQADYFSRSVHGKSIHEFLHSQPSFQERRLQRQRTFSESTTLVESSLALVARLVPRVIRSRVTFFCSFNARKDPVSYD